MSVVAITRGTDATLVQIVQLQDKILGCLKCAHVRQGLSMVSFGKHLFKCIQYLVFHDLLFLGLCICNDDI